MTTSETKTKGQKPTHRIYCVEGEGEKSTWTPIGAAWAHGDGKGFSIHLEAIPLQGRISMRVIADKPADDAAEANF